MQEYQTISSTNILKSPVMVSKNESIVYNLDYTNFYVYWILSAYFPNGTIINYNVLSRYFTQSIMYIDENSATHELAFEKCPLRCLPIKA